MRKTSYLNKLDVGKQIRILNTTQNWVDSKAFRSIAHQTWYMETMLQWTRNWSKIKTKLGTGEVLRLGQQTKIKTKTASNISHGLSGCRALAGRKR